MGQRGFWDELQRVQRHHEKKPILKRRSESIPWEPFERFWIKGTRRSVRATLAGKGLIPSSCSRYWCSNSCSTSVM